MAFGDRQSSDDLSITLRLDGNYVDFHIDATYVYTLDANPNNANSNDLQRYPRAGSGGSFGIRSLGSTNGNPHRITGDDTHLYIAYRPIGTVSTIVLEKRSKSNIRTVTQTRALSISRTSSWASVPQNVATSLAQQTPLAIATSSSASYLYLLLREDVDNVGDDTVYFGVAFDKTTLRHAPTIAPQSYTETDANISQIIGATMIGTNYYDAYAVSGSSNDGFNLHTTSATGLSEDSTSITGITLPTAAFGLSGVGNRLYVARHAGTGTPLQLSAYDATPPPSDAVATITPASTSMKPGGSQTVTITFDKDVTGFAVDDLTLSFTDS